MSFFSETKGISLNI